MSKKAVRKVDLIIYRKQFFSLLADAAWFTLHAEKEFATKHLRSSRRFTHTAILYSALVIECAANCCINSLGLEIETERDLQFSKTLTKFDAYLLTRTGQKHLPRDNPIISRIEDLLAIRNSFAHPKVIHIPHTQKPGSFAYYGQIEKFWSHINIPKEPENCKPIDAKKAFAATSDFFNYFFFELIGLNPNDENVHKQISQIFGTELEEFGAKRNFPVGGRRKLLEQGSDPSVMEIVDLCRKLDLDYYYLDLPLARNPDGSIIKAKRKLGGPLR